MEDQAATPLEELFSKRHEIEHNLIGQRMTWLMTLDGFLVGGAALIAINLDKIGGAGIPSVLFLIIPTVGVLCNTSCLFSNYWGTRSIRESGSVLSTHWAALPSSEREKTRLTMRLYGRDPDSFLGPPFAKPSTILHPWMLLPATFALAFIVGTGSILVATGELLLTLVWLVVTLVSLALFVILPYLDRRIVKRRKQEYGPDGRRQGGPS